MKFTTILLAMPITCACSDNGKSECDCDEKQAELNVAQERSPLDNKNKSLDYDPNKTQLVLLGTGTPIADPDRSGPSVAVVTGGQSYIVDCGPGIVRRASAAHKMGIEALRMEKLTRAFITHLHSDHTAGYADLILTPWVLSRDRPLMVFGPPGTKKMTEHLLEAYAEDIDSRINGNQPGNRTGIEVIARDVEPGVVYEDENVRVKAFGVKHGAWKYAYGYRFEAADRTIVISGDTVPEESIEKNCNGCDALVHEVYSQAGFDEREENWKAYHAVSHTSSIELGKLASRARPKLLVLYHQLIWSSTKEKCLEEVRRHFKGNVVYGNDLEVY